MTRFIFGGTAQDVYMVQDATTGYLKPAGGAQALFYADASKQQRYTDLQTISGQGVNSLLTETSGGVWAAGQIAPFLGPNDVTEMYVSVAGSPPFLIQASQFGSYALPLLQQLQQVLQRPAPAVGNLVDVDPDSVGTSTTGQAIVKLSSGKWGAGTVAAGTGGGGGGTGDVTLAGAQTFTGTKTFSAGMIVRPASVSTVATAVQALSSQTANLEEWRSSAGTALAWVDANGNLYAPNTGRTFTMSKTGTLAVGTGSSRIYNDTGTALKIRSVRASLGTAASANPTTFDIRVSGTSIYTTIANRPSIIAGSQTSGRNTGFNAGATIPDGSYITMDVAAAGTGAADCVVQLDVW